MKRATIFSLVCLAVAGGALAGLPESARVGKFYAGCQAYTFRLFSVMEAIEKTAEAGGKTIQFYPRQALLPGDKDTVFNHDSPAETRELVKKKLADAGVHAAAYGVIRFDMDQAASRRIFEFAKDMGIGVIVTEPAVEALDHLEALAKEYNIKVAIHNHPKKENDESYRYWDPQYVLDLVKDRDPLMGACADTGHWMRSGLDPVESVKLLKGRIHDSHLKDLNVFGDRKAHDVPFGTGVGKVGEVLQAMLDGGFDGPIHIEYEHNWENSVPEVKQCIDFIRQFGSPVQ
jgi:sugar phosphate isomerase/epimerase